MLGIHSLSIGGAYLVRPEPVQDERGWFTRYFCTREFDDCRPDLRFVQFNHSLTRRTGSVRGLHLQVEDAAEEKLVRCVQGRVLDVIVDLRQGSPTFLDHATVVLAPEPGDALFIPKGVAHGFQTLEPDTQLIYHHSNYYAPGQERGVRFDDPMLAIGWPLPVVDISEKDRSWRLLTEGFRGFDVSAW
jgi:dTDP-4-dehydrorhamnose 3,5-epimerase